MSLRPINCGSSSHLLTERAANSHTSGRSERRIVTGKNASRTFERDNPRGVCQSVYAQRQSVANRPSTAYGQGGAVHRLGAIAGKLGFMQRYQRLASEYGPNNLALQAAMASELTACFAANQEPVSFGVAGDLMTSWA